MNLNDMVSLIQARLEFRDDQKDNIIKEINLAQYELERDVSFNPYFLWRGKDICVNETCLNFPVPAGFIRLCEFNNPLWHEKGCPYAYEIGRAVANKTYAADNPVGSINFFSLQGSNIRLSKRASGILRLFYITATTPLSEAVPENLWTQKAFALLMNRAGLQMANILRDARGVEFFEKSYAESLFKFKKECIAFEDFGYDIARADNLYRDWNNSVGGWYEPGAECQTCEVTP